MLLLRQLGIEPDTRRGCPRSVFHGDPGVVRDLVGTTGDTLSYGGAARRPDTTADGCVRVYYTASESFCQVFFQVRKLFYKKPLTFSGGYGIIIGVIEGVYRNVS